MKKLQKVFSILLTVCMCMSLLSVGASAVGPMFCIKVEHDHETGECQLHEHSAACFEADCGFNETDPYCGKTVHAHGDGKCNTAAEACNNTVAHTHGDGNCICPVHVHGDGSCTCATTAHTHGDGYCNSVCPLQGTENHQCDETCTTSCTLEEHTHGATCCSLDAHTHDATCCTLKEHTHDATCCSLDEYAHTSDCYHTHTAWGEENTCFTKGICGKVQGVCVLEAHTHTDDCYAADDDVVMIAGKGGYATLADAVAAANAEADADTIILLADIAMDAKMTIGSEVTIVGNGHALTRDTYLGTFFAVNSGATLTLDGVTIDGNNDWTFLKDEFEADAKDGVHASNSSAKYAVYEEGAPVGAGTLISISGKVVLDSGTTIKNHVGCQLFSVATGAKLITNAATITHNTKGGTPLVAGVSGGGYWEINEGAVISNNHTYQGNGTLSYMCGTTVMNGGEIYGNTGVDCNGCVMMVYGGSASFTMNGGHIYANGATYGDSNGWNPAFYVYGNGAHFTMNGGIIEDQISETYGGIANNGSNGLITLTGGTIINTISGRGANTKDLCSYCLVKISNTMNSATNRFYGSVENTGILNGDSWFYTYEMTYSGGGTFNGDVTVRNGAETTMVDGKWINGVVYVNAVGTDSTLTVKPEATIDGIQVRVMDSVESGDCTNAEQASAAQAASYVEEEGAVVESPVLYYHRLTSAQKQNLVITYDYNGGLDACGWSGTQVTTDGATYLPTAEELARPSREGYTLAGWKFAADNEPECLTMEDNGETYYTIGDETISELTGTLRLIAQWTNESGSNEGGNSGSTAEPDGTTGGSNNSPSGGSTITPDVTIEDEDTPLADGVEIGEEDVPLAALPEENEPQVTLPEEEVPLAVAPMTGDAAALWLALSALSGTGLAGVTFLGRKKNKED